MEWPLPQRFRTRVQLPPPPPTWVHRGELLVGSSLTRLTTHRWRSSIATRSPSWFGRTAATDEIQAKGEKVDYSALGSASLIAAESLVPRGHPAL